jgi:toxin YxiD
VTKWGRDANGKSFSVEWRAKNGAEVNIDIGHTKNGPDVPRIGYQTGGKEVEEPYVGIYW